jgi:integrase
MGRINAFECPPDKAQAFLWDSDCIWLGVRKTPNGKPAFVFQGSYRGKDVRQTIGSVAAWGIPDAQARARELQREIDQGRDPRDLKHEADAAHERKLAEAAARAVLVGDAWLKYLAEGKPKRKEAWKPRYKADMEKMGSAGGEPKKRGKGKTRHGPLYPLMSVPLMDVNEDCLKEWFDKESQAGRHQAARALMMFRGFLRWCSSRKEYRPLIDRDAPKAESIQNDLPSNTSRTDALGADELKPWWAEIEQLENRTASVYLRALLLTGARREEMAALTWANVDFRWRKLTIADKVDQTRTIPLSPYLAELIGGLPRNGKCVFAAQTRAGWISNARASMDRAAKAAGIPHLTLHGLRRSFSLFGERSGAPAGAIAQVMGHKPSATAEKYRPRTLDDLRPFLERIEQSILDLAGVKWEKKRKPGDLYIVGGQVLRAE